MAAGPLEVEPPKSSPWGWLVPFRRLFLQFSAPSQGAGSYLPGIDGLRALAVLAVLLFHGDVERLSGGFLGVEVFFVISGYLITMLLLREWHDTGRMDLPAFWMRRGRRLLPALAVVVVGVLAYSAIFLPEELRGLRSDALSAAGYATNWWLVFGEQSYFEVMGRPSLLQHLWSLAVEEQFYLLWPVLLFALLRITGRRGALAVTLAGAAGSYALMWWLHDPAADPSRVYYGTDTRAGALLAGAALAMLWNPARLAASRNTRFAANGAGAAGLAVLAMIFLAADEGAAWLYPWGFVATAAATLAVIAATVHPASNVLTGGLGSAPMRWAGTRSYGLYLWHWPIFMVTRPGLDVDLDGADLLLGRLALTILAAELSFRLVEQPFRRGFRRQVRTTFRRYPVPTRVVSFGGGFAAIALAVSAFQAHPAASPSYMNAGGFHGVVGGQSPTAVPTSAPTGTPTSPTTPTSQPAGMPAAPTEAPATPTEIPAAPTDVPPTPTQAPPIPTPAPTEPPTPPPPPAPTQPPPEIPPPTGAAIYAVGDSVLVGAAPYMGVCGAVEVDAQVGRHVSGVISVVRALRDSGRMPEVLIVHTGNNGPLTVGQAEEIVALAGEAKVVFVTVRVDRPWESTTNASAWAVAANHPNVRVADWHAASEGRPDIFISDGIHLRPEGGQLFAAVVAAAIP